MWLACGDVQLFVFYLSNGLVRVCEIELYHMGKNKGNPDLVCENLFSYALISTCQVILKL